MVGAFVGGSVVVVWDPRRGGRHKEVMVVRRAPPIYPVI